MNDEIASPALKIGTVWIAVGITSWADFAAAAAALYTLILIGEWLWKKLIRPVCYSHRWIKRPERRHADKN